MPAQKWSVLVVSEEAGALEAIADTLTTRGHRVLTAPGGYEALPLLERDHRARGADRPQNAPGGRLGRAA
jgi:CheY-like chemotaxis protein